MAGNHRRRKRQIDINTISPEAAEQLEKQISAEIVKIMDGANEKCTKILNCDDKE
jgi:3-hydroxyisobutyrate dehydrogenase-like beta-hydroxyacid dehydrogenase